MQGRAIPALGGKLDSIVGSQTSVPISTSWGRVPEIMNSMKNCSTWITNANSSNKEVLLIFCILYIDSWALEASLSLQKKPPEVMKCEGQLLCHYIHCFCWLECLYVSGEECLELREAINIFSYKRYHVKTTSGQEINKYIYLQIYQSPKSYNWLKGPRSHYLNRFGENNNNKKCFLKE